jgi:hypothetical protein
VLDSWLAETTIEGNHDLSLDPSYAPNPSRGWNVAPEDHERCRRLLEDIPGLVYLQHSSATVHLPRHTGLDDTDEDGGTTINVFGSPCSPLAPEKKQNWAFQYASEDAETIWSTIPAETDLLLTHTPPLGYCDTSGHWTRGGCPALLNRLRKVRPALHICGHCHEGRGAVVVRWADDHRSNGSEGASEAEEETESVRQWEDPGAGSKKQSLLDLTGVKGGQRLERGRETAVVNASFMAKSWEKKGAKVVSKPVVVDVVL